jgi:hypothetical protein
LLEKIEKHQGLLFAREACRRSILCVCSRDICLHLERPIEVQYAQFAVLLLDQLVELKATILVFGI